MSPLTESTRLTLAKSWDLAGFDADAAAYIQRVEWADTTPLESATRTAINNFVVGCKADGIWTAIKASCILAGARTLAGALMPLAGTAPTNNNFVTGDYNRKTGLVGDGSSKYLNSNRAGNTDPQNSFHQSVFISTVGTSGAGQYPVYIGTSAVGGNDRNIYRDQNNGALFSSFNSGMGSSTASGTATGFAAHGRSASNATALRVAAANIAGTFASIAPSSNNIGIFAATGVNLSITYNNARLAFYSIGESLDLALLDTRASALITAFGVAIP
jgi:hypothetical protein